MRIDKNLTYKYHKDYIGFKISEVFGIIANSSPKNSNQNLPFFDFPLYILWNRSLGPSSAQVYLKNIFILQNRALRLVFFAGNSTHAMILFVSKNVLIKQ